MGSDNGEVFSHWPGGSHLGEIKQRIIEQTPRRLYVTPATESLVRGLGKRPKIYRGNILEIEVAFPASRLVEA